MDGDLTYKDFLQRLNIQDVLIDAGYQLNRRDGLRYPSYITTDSDGRRVHGDKFLVTANGQCCFQPPQQKLYNIISFIKEHPEKFNDYHPGMSTARLVNLVCNRLLNNPIQERSRFIQEPKGTGKPFSLNDYNLLRFDTEDRNSHKPFYFYFKARGIDLYTQYVFNKHFFLATKQRNDGLNYTNLAFPLTKPGDNTIIGLEERGRPRMDGSSTYKGKAEGSNGSEGLWIANLKNEPLNRVGGVSWFESAFDAMSFHQIHRDVIKQNPELARKSIYVSTGGSPTRNQIKGMLEATPQARHYLCFDNDKAGRGFVELFRQIAKEQNVDPDNVRVMPIPMWAKDWNDVLMDKTSDEHIQRVKEMFDPLEAPQEDKSMGIRR